jgi:hypothetical protein
MELTDYEKEQALREQYNDMLDECYPPYKIGYMEYTASQILEATDPIAYRVGLSDYEASLEE